MEDEQHDAEQDAKRQLEEEQAHEGEWVSCPTCGGQAVIQGACVVCREPDCGAVG